MLRIVEEEKVYASNSGLIFRVIGLARHAQDCSHSMVVYVNLEPTKDAPIGTLWVISENLFMKRFRTLEPYEVEGLNL